MMRIPSTVLRAGAAAIPFAALAAAAVGAAAPGAAAGCGPGTVYDAATDQCVVAPAPPPAAPAAWDAPAPPPGTPPLPPISICPPIPFVAVCFPVN